MGIDWTTTFAQRAVQLTASEIRELLKLLNQPDIISFAGGIPDPALFPYERLAQAYQAILADPARRGEAMQYSISEGYPPLRDFIVKYLARVGVATHRDNVMITNGSQQGLEFLAKLFINPGDRIVVTRPAYLGALQAFSLYEPQVVPVPLDDTGIDLAGLEREFKRGAKFVYLTPDFGNPSGVTLPLDQRLKMLEMSYQYGVPVIEDQAYDQLRYSGEAVPTFLALDGKRLNQQSPLSEATSAGNVIYTGTFSKSIAPALRIGWVVAPTPVLQKLVLMKQASDLHSATINQMVMCEVADEILEDHAARLRQVYGSRRDAMLAALDRHLPKGQGLHWTRPDGGMFVWITLPPGIDGADLLAKAIAEERIAFVPGSAFYADRSTRNTIRLSFSLPSPETIDEGISRLGRLLERELAKAKAA
ncbi:MAG: PLP-dependent aminotransferase family protein [Alphaproteobacteria bacterium]|jgi:DNA-binding transcriptional MocR family regulator|nr:PLP-dependent aminotransferase family protein [Alphaproteobacteria bacterium]